MAHSITQSLQRPLFGRVGILSKSFKKSGELDFHNTVIQNHPNICALKLPDNYQDINASEVGQFSPLRSRDISGSFINHNTEDAYIDKNKANIDITVDNDPHVEPYDCRGAVNLSSSMQSNVPSPFGGQGSILGMPGSQWGQGYKYLSDYLHHSHYLTLRNSYSRALHSVSMKKGISYSYHTIVSNSTNMNNHFNALSSHNCISIGNIRVCHRFYSSIKEDPSDKSSKESNAETKQLTRVELLKKAVAEYGSTVIVFHVAISLVSLGGFYLLVSSGIDIMQFISYLGIDTSTLSTKVTANASTFVLAYGIHKIFAPIRIGITLTATPLIVRYLRKVGVLKAPIKGK